MGYVPHAVGRGGRQSPEKFTVPTTRPHSPAISTLECHPLLQELLRALHAAEQVISASSSRAPQTSLRQLVRSASGEDDEEDTAAKKQEREEVWRKAVAQRKKLVTFTSLPAARTEATIREALKKTAAMRFQGDDSGKESRVFVMSCDLFTQKGREPWLHASEPDEKALSECCKFLKTCRGANDAISRSETDPCCLCSVFVCDLFGQPRGIPGLAPQCGARLGVPCGRLLLDLFRNTGPPSCSGIVVGGSRRGAAIAPQHLVAPAGVAPSSHIILAEQHASHPWRRAFSSSRLACAQFVFKESVCVCAINHRARHITQAVGRSGVPRLASQITACSGVIGRGGWQPIGGEAVVVTAAAPLFAAFAASPAGHPLLLLQLLVATTAALSVAAVFAARPP